jgi:hypothetical protein
MVKKCTAQCPLFILNEKVAKLIGMMPDGSITKTLTSVMFSQKKNPKKSMSLGGCCKNFLASTLSLLFLFQAV